MPYIDKESKLRLADSGSPETPGELNFAFTAILIDYVKRRGKTYQTLNDVIGALECAKLEFQRRVVAPYEDKKIRENGDVYPVVL